MSTFKILLFFLIVISESIENENNVPCLGENDNIQQLNQWWNEEMSVKKPIQCQAPKRWNIQKDKSDPQTRKIMSIFNDRIPVKSYPCEKLTDETSIKYMFTGKVEDGVLTGPGKLFLTGNQIRDSNEACLRINRIMV